MRAAAVFALGCLVQAYELPPPPAVGHSSSGLGDGSPSSTHSAESMPPGLPSAVLPAATRTAVERAIACHLLNVRRLLCVYCGTYHQEPAHTCVADVFFCIFFFLSLYVLVVVFC